MNKLISILLVLLFSVNANAWTQHKNLNIKTVVLLSSGIRVYFQESSGCGTGNYLFVSNDDIEYKKSVLSLAMTAYTTNTPVSFYATAEANHCSGSQYFSFAADGLPGLW